MQTITSGMKLCKSCGEVKAATAEIFLISKATGRCLSQCRDCQRARVAKFGKDNPDQMRVYKRDKARHYRAIARGEAEPAKKPAKVAAPKKGTGRRGKVLDCPVLEAKRLKRNEYMRDFYYRNPSKWYLFTQLARARKYGVAGKHTFDDLLQKLASQNNKCFYCQKEIVSNGAKRDSLTVDHYIPMAAGGSNWPDNIVAACSSCNSSKLNSLPWEWMPERFSKPEGWES